MIYRIISSLLLTRLLQSSHCLASMSISLLCTVQLNNILPFNGVMDSNDIFRCYLIT